MNVLIVEDEGLAAERLEKLLNDYDPDIKVLQIIDTVKDAAVFMRNNENKLDLVFLDIQLADGKSFEIFNKINYSKPVIFTTAYDEYALKAFKINSIDYLLKPIRLEELEAAVQKFKKLTANKSQIITLDEELIRTMLLKGTKAYKQRFLVKFGNRIQFKNTSEVAYFSAEDKICHLYLIPLSKKYLIEHTLEELDNTLLDPDKFFRINRQVIINIDAIKEVNSNKNSVEVLLTVPCESKLKVSRGRIADFKNWLNK